MRLEESSFSLALNRRKQREFFFLIKAHLVCTIGTCKYITCMYAVSLLRITVHLLSPQLQGSLFVQLVRARKGFCLYKRTITVYSCSCQMVSRDFFIPLVSAKESLYVQSLFLNSCTSKAYDLLLVLPNGTCKTRTNFPGSIACM